MENIKAIEQRGIDTVIKAVEKAALTKTTRTRYNSNNFAYIRWLLRKRPHLLHAQLREEIAQVEGQDLTRAKKEKKSAISLLMFGWDMVRRITA